MALYWFKFYGGEYLSDPKILALTASERSCWITLLSYASISEIPGEIKYLDEYKIMVIAGLNPTDNEWDKTVGFLSKMEKLGMLKQNDNEMITIINFRKRQGVALSNYERVKKYREKKQLDNKMITHETEVKQNDNTRIDKNRIEEKRKKEISEAKPHIDKFETNKYPKEYYIKVLDEYQRLKDIKLQGDEFLPPMKEIKLMFKSGRTKEQIIETMEVCEDNYEDWTMSTVRLKIADVVGGKLKSKNRKGGGMVVLGHKDI